MKRPFLVFGSIACLQFFAAIRAQQKATPPTDALNKTEIAWVYNHYAQDGNTSAVTGGVGTEKLTVYGPNLNWTRTKGKHSIGLQLGADIISSASTDNIDRVLSSASILDARSFLNLTYKRSNPQKNLDIYGGGGFSIESDYFSLGSKFGIIKTVPEKRQTYEFQVQLFNDDLRWGRLNKPSNFKPVKLIYPQELRFKEWYTTYKRTSVTLKTGFTQALNKRMVLGVFPEFAYQNGLLATPFHRVYFTDRTLAVEQLPDTRFKSALGIKLHQFLGGSTILKNQLTGYTDSFGITAISFTHESAFKISNLVTLAPHIRLYTQKGASFFKPFQGHDPNATFYTSDYDYATLKSLALGMALRYRPVSKPNTKTSLNTFIFRYQFYKRSQGLSAHVFALSFLLDRSHS